MRTTLFLIVVAAFVLETQGAPCSVSPAVLDVLRNPVTATDTQWATTRKTLDAVVFGKACAAGPSDATSRALVFSVLEAEMKIDYRAVFKEWERRDGKPVAEGAAEGPMYFQRGLLAYIDRIVTPDDVAYKDIILKYGRGEAISKLGRAVRNEVRKQAGTPPKFFYGVEARNPQEEAFRAIGFWLNPADRTLTAVEKKEFAMFAAGALPPDGEVMTGVHERAVTTIVEALGKSDVPELEGKLRAWRHAFENKNGFGHALGRIAQESADKVKARVKKHS